jgi:hypothetical protein
MYLAFSAATRTDWKTVRTHLDYMKSSQATPGIATPKTLGIFIKYLTGVYAQGTCDFDTALAAYQDPSLSLETTQALPMDSAGKVQRDLGLLAALNSLHILQEPSRLNPDTNTAILSTLEPLCKDHPVRDIQTAFLLTKMFVITNPRERNFMIKNYAVAASSGCNATNNTQLAAYLLSLMHQLFFKETIGLQAAKSAQSAFAQAQKSRNELWMSVTAGMLSESLEAHGDSAQAAAVMVDAMMHTQAAIPEKY